MDDRWLSMESTSAYLGASWDTVYARAQRRRCLDTATGDPGSLKRRGLVTGSGRGNAVVDPVDGLAPSLPKGARNDR